MKNKTTFSRIQFMVKCKGFQQIFVNEDLAREKYEQRKTALETKEQPFKIELLQIEEDGKTSILEVTKMSASAFYED